MPPFDLFIIYTLVDKIYEGLEIEMPMVGTQEIDVKDIENAKVSGLLTGVLKIKTSSGVVKYPIVQGKGAVKQILLKLGL